MLEHKLIDLGFTDPGLNDNVEWIEEKSVDAIDTSEMLAKAMDSGLSYSDKLILITLSGIGARMDRLIKMVNRIERP